MEGNIYVYQCMYITRIQWACMKEISNECTYIHQASYCPVLNMHCPRLPNSGWALLPQRAIGKCCTPLTETLWALTNIALRVDRWWMIGRQSMAGRSERRRVRRIAKLADFFFRVVKTKKPGIRPLGLLPRLPLQAGRFLAASVWHGKVPARNLFCICLWPNERRRFIRNSLCRTPCESQIQCIYWLVFQDMVGSGGISQAFQTLRFCIAHVAT